MYSSLLKSCSVLAIGLSIVYATPAIAEPTSLPMVKIGELTLTSAKKLFKEKKYSQALLSINQTLHTKPYNIEAQMLRGQILLALQKNNLVIEQMNKLLMTKPNYAKAYNLRALALYQTKNYKLALRDLNMAISLDNKYVNAIFNRGVLYMATNHSQEALNDFEQVIALDPNHFDALTAREKLNDKLNDLKELNKINHLIDANPSDAANYYARSLYNFNKKLYKQAILDASMAIELNPLFAEAYYLKGVALYQLGDLSQARENFLKSTQYSFNQIAVET